MTELTDRERRWLDALLIIGTLLATILLIGAVSGWLFYFSDILLIFFLAWLLAFVINPLASFMVHTIPGLPRAGAVVLTYALLLVVLTGVALFVAGSLATSTQAFLASVPQSAEPAGDRQAVAGLAGLDRPAGGPGGGGSAGADQRRFRRHVAGGPADQPGGGQPGPLRQPDHHHLPVALPGYRRGADDGLHQPPRAAALRRGIRPPRGQRVALVRRLPARAGAHRLRVRPGRGGHEPRAGPRLRTADGGQLGHPAGHPILWPVHLVGPAGGRGAPHQARRPAARPWPS